MAIDLQQIIDQTTPLTQGAATAVEATGTAEVAGVPVSVVQDIGFVIVLDYWMFFAIEKPD